MSVGSEPALRSYFFGKGYRDLLSTIRESWERNLASAGEHFEKVRRHLGTDENWWAIVWGAAGLSVVLFGTAVFALASVIHVVTLGAFFLFIYLGFTIVYLLERSYLAWKGFFVVCPDCHSKNPLPEYFCPGCGEVHRRLIPSSYGILRHTCTCGESLPATFFLNRGELQARCPDCETLLSREHSETRKLFVPVLGGPAVGKSAYLFAVVRELIEKWAPHMGWEPQFLEPGTEAGYQKALNALDRGRPPDKTSDRLPRALNLKLQRDGETPRLVYLYDPAGEAFSESGEMVLHKYQGFVSGLVLLVDPFSLPEVGSEYHDELQQAQSSLQPSALPVVDVVSRVLISLEESFGLGKTSQVRAPLAVVLSKVDAFDLEEHVGQPAVQARLKTLPPGSTLAEARDLVVRDQLRRWGQAALIHQIESRFARVRYFTCSALGHMPDGSGRPFEPQAVWEPLEWILGHADPGLFNQ